MAGLRDLGHRSLDRLVALKPDRIRTSHWLIGLVALVAVLLAVAVHLWWGSLQEALHDPGVPYQTYTPPPAPNYAQPGSWALLPTRPATWSPKDPPADVFFVHPTTYERRANWNGPIDDARSRRRLDEVMIPNYAGPFARVGRVFAPLYRQASLYTQMTLREDARDARRFAYRDIKAAFDLYMRDYNGGRPVIFVGVEQGGFLTERLVREAAADPAVRARIVAVYLLETAVSVDQAPLPVCQTRNQTGCTVAFRSEGFNEAALTHDRLRHAAVWEQDQVTALGARQPICVNPLLGVPSAAAVPPDRNLGAVNAAGLEWGVRPGFQNSQVGAQCVDGILKVTRPKSPALRQRMGWLEQHRVRGFNLFYADLEADAEARLETLLGRPGFGRLAPPLEGSVVIRPSPVRRPR